MGELVNTRQVKQIGWIIVVLVVALANNIWLLWIWNGNGIVIKTER